MNKEIKSLIRKIQPQISYCYNCQPYDDGVVWVLGEKDNLENLFEEHEVPEALRDELANNLKCCNCRTTLERFADISYTNNKEEIKLNKSQIDFINNLGRWQRYYEKSFMRFSAFLEAYPYLGVKHTIGSRIVRSIKNFPKTTIENQVWYRARSISNGRKLRRKDMIPPNPLKAKITEGRYNHFGQSHWYLSSSREAAGREILEGNETFAWVQEVRIIKAENILDVATKAWWRGEKIRTSIIAMGIIYDGALEKAVERDKGWKPEYFIPRFIADSAKLASFKGILFNSNRHFDHNLVLFEPIKVSYEFIGHPRIIESPRYPKESVLPSKKSHK